MPEKLKITLNFKDIKTGDACYKFFNGFTSDNLVKFLIPLVELKLKYNIVRSVTSGGRGWLAFSKIKNMRDLSKLQKPDLVSIMASFDADENNSLALAADPSIRQLWLRLLDDIFVTGEEAEEILGRKPHVAVTSGWNPHINADCVCTHFNIRYSLSYYYYDSSKINEYKFYLGSELRQRAEKYFFGASRIKPILSNEPEFQDGYQIVNLESDVIDGLDYLYGTYEAGKLPGGEGTLTTASITTLVKNNNIDEFPVQKDVKVDWPGRRQLFTVAYCLYMYAQSKKADAKGFDIREFAKFVYNKLSEYIKSTTFSIIYPELTSFTKTWSSVNQSKDVVDIINRLLIEENKAGQWMSLSNLMTRYMCQTRSVKTSSEPYVGLFSSTSQNKSSLKYRANKEKVEEWWTDVDQPYIARWLKLLISCGILEAVYDVKSQPGDTLEGLRYVRYTPLGRYAAGIDSKYTETKTINNEDTIDVDDKNGILTVLKAKSPFEAFLSDVGEKIGGSRFKIDGASLVRGSHSVDTLKINIKRLKRIASLDMKNGIWPAIFDEAEKRMNAMREWRVNYSIIPLNTECPGLIEYLSSHVEISKECLKAEGAILIVPYPFLQRFREILVEGGYRL